MDTRWQVMPWTNPAGCLELPDFTETGLYTGALNGIATTEAGNSSEGPEK